MPRCCSCCISGGGQGLTIQITGFHHQKLISPQPVPTVQKDSQHTNIWYSWCYRVFEDSRTRMQDIYPHGHQHIILFKSWRDRNSNWAMSKSTHIVCFRNALTQHCIADLQIWKCIHVISQNHFQEETCSRWPNTKMVEKHTRNCKRRCSVCSFHVSPAQKCDTVLLNDLS